MTDNFLLIRNYMMSEGVPELEKDMGDLFFTVILVRRGKDHPDLPAANYTFKTYYFDSLEKYDKLKDEIIKCCELLKLRAYVSVNVKSKEEYSKMCSFKFAQNILNNEHKKPWRVGDHVFGKIKAKNNNTWLIDVDNVNLDSEADRYYVNGICHCIRSCDSKYDDPVLFTIPTRSGIHILARPFNKHKFGVEYSKRFTRECPDIKQNHITLLYENI